MFQAVTSIFAMENLGLRMFEGQRDKDFALRRQRIGFEVRTHFSAFDFRGWDSHRDLGKVSRFLKGLIRPRTVASYEFQSSIYNHLGRVGAREAQALCVGLLAHGERVGRECVLPSQVVPVIHMLAQDDQLNSGDRLRAVQLAKQGIGGRTTGTAFRSEQLN
jgi:hypothetical protein